MSFIFLSCLFFSFRSSFSVFPSFPSLPSTSYSILTDTDTTEASPVVVVTVVTETGSGCFFLFPFYSFLLFPLIVGRTGDLHLHVKRVTVYSCMHDESAGFKGSSILTRPDW